MTLSEKAAALEDADFKQMFGVAKRTFEEILKTMRKADAARKRGPCGRPSKPALEERLFMALKYWRQYPMRKEPTFEFGVGESAAHDEIVRVENAPIKSGKFSLPGKEALFGENCEIGIVVVNAKVKVFKIASSRYRNRRALRAADVAHMRDY